MRLSEVMTSRVEYVDPNATVEEAAKRMLACDVGAIPVVLDGRPIGMITDRDIAIRVAASGRNPSTTRIGDVMTRDLVCCARNDSLDSAARVMEKNQVRRLLVLDEDDCLCGILSLGDLAVRTSRDELSEEVLEEVSWPGHAQQVNHRSAGATLITASRDMIARISSRRARQAAAMSAAAFLFGAAAMYLLDPQRGRGRRTAIRDKSASLAHKAQGALGKAGDYARGQLNRGLNADQTDEAALDERVREAATRVSRFDDRITAI